MRRRARLRLLTVAALGLAALHAPTSHAQTSDKALAEAVFREARQLLDAGRTEEACARFEESQRLEPSVGTLMNLALCHEQLGKTASAWAAFVEVAVQAGRAGQIKRELYAKERAAALEAKLARVELVAVDPAPGLSLRLDGRALATGSIGVALPLDPGPHLLEVSAPGRKPWQRGFELAPGPRTERVEIPALELEPAQPTQPGPAAPVQRAPDSSAAPRLGDAGFHAARGSSISPLVWIGLGTFGVGVGVGATTGVLSLTKASELEDACPGGVCPSDRQSDADEALLLANVSNVGFGVAAAGLVAGIVGLVLSDFDSEPTSVAHGLRLGGTDQGTFGIVGRY